MNIIFCYCNIIRINISFRFIITGNGYIDADEYCALLDKKIEEMRISTYFIQKSFTLLDRGCKGYLTICDLSAATGMHGERLTAPEAKEIMEDGNGKDDRLYFEGLLLFMYLNHI